MEDNQILRIALITTILGLAGMILLSDKVMPHEIKIKDLNKGMLDEEVSIEGVVSNIDKSQKSETYFLQIADDTDKTTVVIFDDTVLSLAKYNLTPQSFLNHRVSLTGTVKEYNGNMELILKDGNSLKIIA
ncbi:MAG: DNA-binding protein [Methanobacterium sp.]|uniref:OB-fold nucleic acid binding domain-containing protein n=1 Tax=Methanobacterium sp. TaxID=2164 RepID=UPI003D65115C|nr:DNA-binding protein [Methanobacterium sp.]